MAWQRTLAIVLIVGSLGLSGAPAGAQTAGDLYEQAVAARLAADFDSAIELLQRALALEPDNSDALVQLGFSHLAVDDRPAAETAFDRALGIAPDYHDARYGLAQIAFRNGDLSRADELVGVVIAAQPRNEDAARLAASIAGTREAEATPAPKAVAKTAAVPQIADRASVDPFAAAMAAGDRARQQGDLAGAELNYRRALARSPGNSDILVILGFVTSAQQDFDAAERYFNEALRVAADYTDARAGLIRIALYRGDVAGARDMLSKMDGKDRNGTAMRILAGRVSLREGNRRAASVEFEAVLSDEPDNVEALMGLGDAQRALGQYRAARRSFEQAALLSPDASEIAERLAAPDPKRWRVTLATEYSELSGDRPGWTDSLLAISFQVHPETTLQFSNRLATRGHIVDDQLTFGIYHRVSEILSINGLIAATPDADFLADFSLGGRLVLSARPPLAAIDRVFFDIDARHDVYSSSRVTTVKPGVGIVFFERLTLHGQWVRSQDDSGTISNGYVVRTDLRPTDRLRLFAGYSDAPEISAGALFDTRTIFGGLTFDATETLSLSASYAHENRHAFTRQTFGLALTQRF